jgi:thiamine kinase-like enzyme
LGVTAFEELAPLTAGHTSSLVFRIVVSGAPYVLKIITHPYQPDTMSRYYAAMQSAAAAGIAPRVRYAGLDDRITITDFIETAPFSVADALVRMPPALRTLHSLPPFADVPHELNTSCMFLLNPGPALDGFLQRIRAGSLLPDGEREEMFARHAELAAVYPHPDSEMVSSHNDFKPENVLYDGARPWIVDWEAAFRNDRYADLAVVANFIAHSPAEEDLFLRSYFGQEPSPYQRARFHLARQIAHMFHGLAYLFMGSLRAPVDRAVPLPHYDDFQRRNWAGEVDLYPPAMRILYGRLHCARFLHDTRELRFAEALRIVAGGPE